MIVVVAETILMHPIVEKTSRQRILSVAGVHTCLVKSHWIEACEHSDIRQDRHVILSVAVTVRRNVDHQIDVEVRASVYDRLGVFGDLHVKLFYCGRVLIEDGVEIAGAKAASASDTLPMGDRRMTVLIKRDGSMSTVFGTSLTADTFLLIDGWLSAVVHLHLSGTGTAAHSNILQGAAKPGSLVAFKVIQGNKDVRVHDGGSDLGFLYQLTTFYRHISLVRPL